MKTGGPEHWFPMASGYGRFPIEVKADEGKRDRDESRESLPFGKAYTSVTPSFLMKSRGHDT